MFQLEQEYFAINLNAEYVFFPGVFIATAVFLPIHFLHLCTLSNKLYFSVLLFITTIYFKYIYYFHVCYHYTISYCAVQKGKQHIRKVSHGVTHYEERCFVLRKILRVSESHILE